MQRKTLEERIAEIQDSVEKRLKIAFADAQQTYPPKQLLFVAFKEEKKLEIYAGNSESEIKFVKNYPILAASGHLGPKLREGDRQVPEGIYRVDFLNPNSLYHLSIKLDYPNDFDRLKAQNDNRFSPGSNIMIHGNQVSNGCLAVGDLAIEDLFILSARTGIKNIKVIIAPYDFRKHGLEKAGTLPGLPKWSEELYQKISKELDAIKPD